MSSEEIIDLYLAGEFDVGDVLEFGVFDLLEAEF